ncbi:MAG: diaminopimelate decarboxylase [Chitinophagaceae bacterium]|nr:diaminopimelate decarboxylase [Chitinophagaceae bacterium]HQV61115.1 diaminopimelate decarboxylase [Chitinophagaceae bacterium]HQV84783.1 diaminopimelate decarboxylase [Chitinophagaceae bacterium]HQX71849.1 diaminopimelate decarboxylase [Chitinophagaceae bacterium]HQZ73575.1 diaminopimelate decarboxylase [Chitinophagaceae bacterium]
MSQQLSHEQLVVLAHQFGTPLYVYHAEKIKEQYDKLLTSFKGVDVRFFYAAKALTNINILRYLKSTGCNIDCSSINEAKLAVIAGFAPSDILYTSNNIAFEEIEEAQRMGIHINIDSISNLRKFGQKFGHSYPVGIRLRPNIMAGGNLKISTGHADSKFGVPLEDIEEVLQVIKETGLFIRTLHIHTGSEIKDVEVFAKGIEVLFEMVKYFPELAIIDLGGGFKVPYKPGDEGTDIELLGKKVKEEFEWFEKKYNRHLQVWFEPGKYLVSEAGYFITKVNVLKPAGNAVFAGVDTGLNHFIRPMFYGAYHEIENISNPSGDKRSYNVVGNICETDTFAENRSLPEIREDDYLVFLNAGAYCFEMSSHYNSRFKPAEVMVKDGKPILIRKRDDLEDLLKGQPEIIF